MKLEDVMIQRSQQKCELCESTTNVQLFEVLPQDNRTADNCIMICGKCKAQVEKKEEADQAHWQNCLPNAMWSEVPGIQVTAWRIFNRFRHETWASDNLDMLYLDEEKLAWAKATGDHENDNSVDLHKDCNNQVLQTGDTVVLIKSLDVKGSTLNAKMGTVVKNIRLVENNTEQIEGKIEGQTIVILTKYVRKHNIAS
jgi:protein PhnA